MTSKEMAKMAIEALEDKKAEDIQGDRYLRGICDRRLLYHRQRQ